APPALTPEPLLDTPLQTPPGQKMVPREAPEPDEKRKALVDSMTNMVKQAKTFWEPTFKKMAKDQKFAEGIQWNEDPKVTVYGDSVNDDLYVANITLQHIQKRVAAVYAKNPKASCRRRPRILSTVWDGTMESLTQAQGVMQQAQQASMLAMMAMGKAMGMGGGVPGAGPPGLGGGTGGMPPAGSIPPGPMAGAQGGAPAGAPMDAAGSPGAPGPESAPGSAMPAPPAPMMPPAEEIQQSQSVIQDAQSVKQQLTIL